MHKKVLMSWLIVCIISSAGALHATVINVPTEAITIQAGIDSASEGDTVLVAAGAYSGEGNYDLTFGGKNITVMSIGSAENTTIDCNRLGRAFTFLNQESSLSKVSGFTIINGSSSTGGGAIYCDTARPIIENCVFRNNTAIVRGGAIYATNEAHIQVINCTFYNNTASDYGGGLYLHWGSDATVIDCIFSGNQATHGGAFIIDKSTPIVSGNLFIHNTAEQLGGAVFIQDDCQSTIHNCTFVDNSGGTGSVFFIDERYAYWPIDVKISNCILAYNKNDDPIVLSDGLFDMQNTDIFGNDSGDWVGSIEDYYGTQNNFSEDPEFCDLPDDNYHLRATSPCAPLHNSSQELIGALGVGCGTKYYLDIKPGACPNPINLKGKRHSNKAVIPMAILGTEEFDVMDIDITSLQLLSIAPVRTSYEDVSTPVESADNCACTDEGPGGYTDLTVKFYRNDIIERIPIDFSGSMYIPVTLTGMLKDGTAFEATDCFLLKYPGDLNNSGYVDIDDLILFIDYVFNRGNDQIDMINADLNDDNIIDVGDLLALIEHMFR